MSDNYYQGTGNRSWGTWTTGQQAGDSQMMYKWATWDAARFAYPPPPQTAQTYGTPPPTGRYDMPPPIQPPLPPTQPIYAAPPPPPSVPPPPPPQSPDKESYQRSFMGSTPTPPPAQNYNRNYQQSGGQRYNNYYNDRRYNGDYSGGGPSSPYKRSASQMEGDMRNNRNNSNNKKKKPPQKPPVKYSQEDCNKALELEKALNVLHKNSLVVRFPDFEITREMVMGFDSSISSVYFPSSITQRNCFIALSPTADVDETIRQLSTIKPPGAAGYLTVERKQNPTPKPESGNIDPLTLYVGNLPNDITKDEILQLFPNHRRIDIGYAKKMKYTRYAFISYNTLEDSMKAFTNTFNEIMHGKSIIVRFKRLHGTNGQPGEPKPQNPQKTEDGPEPSTSVPPASEPPPQERGGEAEPAAAPPVRVKDEPLDYDYVDEEDLQYYGSSYLPGNVDDMFTDLRNSYKNMKTEVKEEKSAEQEEAAPQETADEMVQEEAKPEEPEAEISSIRVKQEFLEIEEGETKIIKPIINEVSFSADDPVKEENEDDEEDEEEEFGEVDLEAQLKRLNNHAELIKSIRQATNEKKMNLHKPV